VEFSAVTGFSIFLLTLSALLVAGGVWAVRSRRVDVLLGASTVLATSCVAVGGLFIIHHSPECLVPGGVLAAGGVVALSMCTVALALWVRPDGKV
jgi:hypothetical protein